jgi:hypothetical protein
MRCGLLLIGCLLCASLSTANAQTLHLTRNEGAIEQKIAETLLAEIYKRAGLEFKVEPLPAARANILTIRGEKDGEVARIRPYFDKNPSLIRVEPSYYYLTTRVFAKAGRKLVIKDQADLANYRIGIVRGIVHAEAATAGIKHLEVVSKYEQLYRMVDANRIDLAIDTGINGQATLAALGMKSVEPVGELARLELFHVLTAKQAALAPKLGAVIQAMKKSGELEKLTRRIEEEATRTHTLH